MTVFTMLIMVTITPGTIARRFITSSGRRKTTTTTKILRCEARTNRSNISTGDTSNQDDKDKRTRGFVSEPRFVGNYGPLSLLRRTSPELLKPGQYFPRPPCGAMWIHRRVLCDHQPVPNLLADQKLSNLWSRVHLLISLENSCRSASESS